MIGFVVEGRSDRSAVYEICRKLNLKTKESFIRPIRGGFNPRRVKSHAEDLLSGGCEKVIILRDSHSSDPLEKREEVKEKLQRVELKIREGVKLCIVVHAIESWFLADEKAIGDYLGIKVREIHNPENICKPDERLEGIFKAKERSYLKGGKRSHRDCWKITPGNGGEEMPFF